MRRFIDADGNPTDRVYLEMGEVTPMLCRCNFLYQPPMHTKQSFCPDCGTLNTHNVEWEWRIIK